MAAEAEPDPPADVLAALAGLQTSLATLAKRVTALEDAGRSSQAANRQLGLDLATFGRTLNDHLRAEPDAAHTHAGHGEFFLRRPPVARPRKLRAGPLLIASLGLILALAAIAWANRAALGLQPQPRPAAAAVVVLGDTANATLRPVESETGGEPGDRSGHALYGAGEVSSAPPRPGKP